MNKVRVRACGLCLIDDQLLLVRHQGIGETGIYWSPPGGGVEFGETLEQSLHREFMEETGLEINVGDFLFMHEFIGGKLHALEMFFAVTKAGGKPKLGFDPEFKKEHQMMKELRLFSSGELAEVPTNQKHQILSVSGDFQELLELRGHFKSENYSIK